MISSATSCELCVCVRGMCACEFLDGLQYESYVHYPRAGGIFLSLFGCDRY